MGSRLSIRRETFVPAENQTWLGSAHGTSEAKSISVDGDAAIAAGFTDGLVPSGVAMFKLPSGRYSPVTAGNEAAAEGELFTTTRVVAGDVTSAPLYWHGRVILANVPAARGTYVGHTAAVRTALSAHIKFD